MNGLIKIFTTTIGLLIVPALFFLRCTKDDPEPQLLASSVELISGGDQEAIIGFTLAEVIEIIVKDQNGNAYAGSTVHFSVSEGSVSSALKTTDVNGKAFVSWTLSVEEGIQELNITAFESDGTTPLKGSPLTVRALSMPEPLIATSIELVTGGDQEALAGADLANIIEVLVKDQNGDPFEGAIINFSVAEGAVSSASDTTDAEGKAHVTWTLGATEGAQSLTVTALKADGVAVLDGAPISISATAIKLEIGDFYAGGVVFYLYKGGRHGILCATKDHNGEYPIRWSGGIYVTVGITKTTIGTGQENTSAILEAQGTAFSAAQVCDEFELNDCSDWFLPSKDELNEMYKNRVAINSTAINNGGTNFEAKGYWSSSELGYYYAWMQDFGSPTVTQSSTDKSYMYKVRPVRTF